MIAAVPIAVANPARTLNCNCTVVTETAVSKIASVLA
jgi:hypothetical protein